MKYQLTITRKGSTTIKVFSNRKEAVKAYNQSKTLASRCYNSLTRSYLFNNKIRVQVYREYKDEFNNNIKTFEFGYDCERDGFK